MSRLAPLLIDEVIQYVEAIPGLFPPGTRLTASEISDGDMNFVFRAKLTVRSVLPPSTTMIWN